MIEKRPDAMAVIRGFTFPDELHYLMAHDAWVRLDADGMATVGITQLGAHISGEFIEFMPKPIGTVVERERSLGLLEMSKVLRSMRAPVAGTIVTVNEQVRTQPSVINADPYGDGWLVRLQPAAWTTDVSQLVTCQAIVAAAEAYMALLSETFRTPPAAT